MGGAAVTRGLKLSLQMARGLCLVFVFCVQATSIAEVLCLTAFFGRLVHFAKVTPQMVFWKDMKNICIMVTIVVSAHYSALKTLWSKAETMKRKDSIDLTWLKQQ